MEFDAILHYVHVPNIIAVKHTHSVIASRMRLEERQYTSVLGTRDHNYSQETLQLPKPQKSNHVP